MSSASRPQTRLPDLLIQNHNFVLLWAAYGISAFGDHLSESALLKTSGAFEGDASVRFQALMTFCFFLPFALLGPVSGWWADRFSRKWTMIACDMIRAAIMVTIPFSVPLFQGWGLGDFGIALPLLLAGIFAAFFSPARQAMVPTLIRDDQLVRANALISGLGTIGAILSGVLAGYLVRWSERGHFGLVWNYRLDTLTFLASAILLAGIAMSRSRAMPHAVSTGLWVPVRAGFEYVRDHGRILQMILLYTVFWAASGVIVSVVPAIVRDVFGGDFADIGIYRGLIVAGLAAGAIVLTILGRTVPLQLTVLASTLGAAVYVGLLDLVYVYKWGKLLSGFCLVMIGAHGAGILISVTVVIQRLVPDARRGRVFGVADMATMAAMVLATGVLGLPHVPHVDHYIPVLLGAVSAAFFVTTALAWREYRRENRYSGLVWLLWLLVRFYAAFWFRVQRVGHCTAPRRTAAIIAANHSAGIDPLLIIATCPHRLPGFLVAREYCRGLAGWFVRLGGCIPLDREHPGKDALAGALERLAAGECLGVFPQGRFEAPDETVDARRGIGLLALRSVASVIPCHISGIRYTAQTFGSFLRRHDVRVRYGKPVDLSDLRGCGRERDRVAQQLASERIMAAIRALAPAPDADAAALTGTAHES